MEDSRNLFAPNAFSPNADGRNDVFTLYPGKGVSRIVRFQVFDRWGNQLFESGSNDAGALAGWDGTFKGELMNPAVFVWMAEVEFVDGSSRVYEGELSLVR